jgi:hypothetical protein
MPKRRITAIWQLMAPPANSQSKGCDIFAITRRFGVQAELRYLRA